MDIQARFSMTSNPFVKGRKSQAVIDTNELKEVQIRLNYLKDCLGFGLLTGEPGRGKTTAVRKWSEGLNSSQYKVIYTSLSSLTAIEFYRQLASDLGLEPAFRKVENYRNIQERVKQLSVDKRITPVFILDEANYISNSILNDLKMIFNFDMDSKERAIVLLVGLPYLNNTLNLNMHEPLRQRIVMNYHMEALSQEEAIAYINEKLKSVKCNNEVFSQQALHAISSSANGTPRMIDKICNRALLLADSMDKDFIDSDLAMKAINDVQLG